MRRKFNQKGVLGTILFAGAAVAIGMIWVTSASKSLYDVIRYICVHLDSVVYATASYAYSIFYELSSSSLLSSLNLASASQRLYTLLGIFMLFRLAFAFVKYIINPDDIGKGTSKLLTNLAVSLALIVSVPWIFNRAFELQTYIMESNVIGNLIMGMNTTKDTTEDSFNASSYGQTIAFLTFSAFYRPNVYNNSSLTSCSNLLTYYSSYVVPSGDRTVETSFPDGVSTSVMNEAEKIASCVNALNSTNVTAGNDDNIEIGTIFYIASQRQSMSLLTNGNLVNAQESNYYLIDYISVVSTIAGGFLAWLFLCFSFDVAIRNVKLCFLQIIAPIPIILNIEPGDGKKDNRPLSWWTKECLNTYLLLFIRVATVYFGVFLITILFGSGFSNVIGSNNTGVWFKVFMILGILLFVKDIPNLIGKAFGIDVKGQFNLNPLKRIGENRIASMATGAVLGGIGGLGTGIAAYAGARSNGANVGEAIRRGITGGAGGVLHSTISGGKTGAKSIHDITNNATKNWNRSGRVAGANVGTTLSGRTGTQLAMTVGAPTAADRDKNIIDTTSGFKKNVDALYSRAGGEMMKKNGNDVSFDSSLRSIGNFMSDKGANGGLFSGVSATKGTDGKYTVASNATFQKYTLSRTTRTRGKHGTPGGITAGYVSSVGPYTIGDYKSELQEYANAKAADTSSWSSFEQEQYAQGLVEWERGLNIKKKFIEGQAAAEWMVQKDSSGRYHDEMSGIMAEQLVNDVNSNHNIYGRTDVMGANNEFNRIDTKKSDYLENFVGSNSKSYADRADLVSKTYGGSSQAVQHQRTKTAVQASRGGGK